MGTALQPLEEMTRAESLGRKREVAQDALGQTGDIFQKHRLPLAVGAHDEVVKTQ